MAKVSFSVEQTLQNTAVGMIDSCKVTNNYTVISYKNGFAEVIWFKDNENAVIFSDAISAIKRARGCILGEAYVEVSK